MDRTQTQTYIQSMDAVEARACLIAIRGNLTHAAQLAADFDNRLGWKALGYGSLEACLQQEFGHPTLQAFIQYEFNYSQSQSYRLAAANQVAANIRSHSPMGEPVVLKERWVRESGIADLPPAQQAETFQIAVSIAQAEDSSITSAHFKQAVEQIQAREQVFQSPYAVVSQDVATGKITADVGRAFVTALDALPPRKRGYVVQLMAQFGLTCPDLVARLAGLFERPAGQDSYMLPEVQSGFLGGRPLRLATLSDWHQAASEARRQHQADAAERSRQQQRASGQIVVVETVITLPAHDWQKCIEVLRRELGDNGFERLMRAGMDV